MLLGRPHQKKGKDDATQGEGNLTAELEDAGLVDHGGKGSHRNFVHPGGQSPVTISGNSGDDEKRYQVRVVRLALEGLKE